MFLSKIEDVGIVYIQTGRSIWISSNCYPLPCIGISRDLLAAHAPSFLSLWDLSSSDSVSRAEEASRAKINRRTDAIYQFHSSPDDKNRRSFHSLAHTTGLLLLYKESYPPPPFSVRKGKHGSALSFKNSLKSGRLYYTGPLARLLVCLLAPLNCSLASHCSPRSRAPLRSLIRPLIYPLRSLWGRCLH